MTPNPDITQKFSCYVKQNMLAALTFQKFSHAKNTLMSNYKAVSIYKQLCGNVFRMKHYLCHVSQLLLYQTAKWTLTWMPANGDALKFVFMLFLSYEPS